MTGQRRPIAVLALVALLLPAAVPAAEPERVDMTERVETRIVQIDVSVIDPKSGSRASVPGLTKDMFRLRVGNRRVTGDAYDRVGFDEVCGDSGLPAALDSRSLIVMADFNYLDGQMRWNAAQALRTLADDGVPPGTRVKVIGYTRFLFEIQGFTDDPGKLREAATFIETASGLFGPGVGPDAAIADGGLAGRDLRAVVNPATPNLPAATTARAASSLLTEDLPAPPESYAPGELGGDSQVAVDATGQAAGGPSDATLEALGDKLQTLANLPDVDFGPSLSADPFRARVGGNPGASAPESVVREAAWNRDFGNQPSFQQVQSAASLAADLVPENSGIGRVERLGYWDHRSSLAAIEAVLRGHAGVRGRKALVVFTAEDFETTNFDDLERETRPVLEAAQQGFSLWMVDSRGFYEVFEDDERGESRLITMLAKNSGGEPLRDAGDLAAVFPRISESLDCYYLFSIPVPRSDEPETLSVSVSLDTGKHKELFGYNVVHSQRVRLHDRPRERELARTAALLNPGDWNALPLRADLSFPLEKDRRLTYLPVEVSVPLSSLDFRPEPEGGVSAEFLVDIAVDRNGKDAVCLVPPKGEATMRKVLMPAAPADGFRGHLVIRNICPYRGAGLYTLRAVLTEPSVEVPGGAQAHYRIDPRAGGELTIAALRAGHNTGQDYLMVDDGAETVKVSRDRRREAFVPLTETEPAATADTMMFRYVVCGPSRDEAVRQLRRIVYADTDAGPQALFALPGAEDPSAPASSAPSPFCVEIEDTLPPGTLAPGRFGFAILAVGETPLDSSELAEALATGSGAGLLATVPFTVEEAGAVPASRADRTGAPPSRASTGP